MKFERYVQWQPDPARERKLLWKAFFILIALSFAFCVPLIYFEGSRGIGGLRFEPLCRNLRVLVGLMSTSFLIVGALLWAMLECTSGSDDDDRRGGDPEPGPPDPMPDGLTKRLNWRAPLSAISREHIFN